MADKYTLPELAGKNLKDLYAILEEAIDKKAGNDQLDLILRECFVQIENDAIASDPDFAHKVMQMSDWLAVDKGVATAVDHYKHHLVWSGDWKEDGELKYSFNDENLHGPISKELQLKIVHDIAAIAEVGLDDVMDKVDGELVGIKIKDTSIANKLINELKSNAGSSVDMEKFDSMSDEEKKHALEWWYNFKKDALDVGWSAWQKTWDKAQKAILDKKNVEEMGEEMCLQMFLLPFKLFENYMSKLDDWAKDFAKKRNSLLTAAADPTPVPPPKDPLEPPEEAKRELCFIKTYSELLTEEGKTDPERKKFAEEFKNAWFEEYPSKLKMYTSLEDFTKANPDLSKKWFKDFDHTLVENFVRAYAKLSSVPPGTITDFDKKTELAVQLFFAIDLFPNRVKNDFLDKFKEAGINIPEEWYKRTDEDDRKRDHGDHDHTDDEDERREKDGDDREDDGDTHRKKEDRDDRGDDGKGHRRKEDHDDRGDDGERHKKKKGHDDHEDPSMHPSNSAPARAEARIRAIIWGKSEVNGVDPDGNAFTETKNDALRNPYLISAKTVETTNDKGESSTVVHHYGTIVDDKSKTITRYHEQDGKITSVTYCMENGSAVIRESIVNDGKVVASKAEKHVTGLTTDTPTLDGKPLTPGKAKQWQELFGRNEAFYKIGVATNFTGSFGMGHKIAQTVQDQTEQKTQWNLINETLKSKKTR